MMDNKEIAAIFDQIADILELKEENPFRIRSYRRVAETLTNLGFAGSDYQVRLAALDSYLDLCESLISKETQLTP